MCVGVLDKNQSIYSEAKEIGNSVLYLGSDTGRDGCILNKVSQEKKPEVQAGDPLSEKSLLEAYKQKGVIASQYIGTAGLTRACEYLLSEFPERMMMVIEAGREKRSWRSLKNGMFKH